jgi:siroheme synthase
MGAQTLPVITRQLVQHGLASSTPVALISNGTTDRERRVVGTLSTIERLAQRAALQGPALCMVGDVVGLALGRDQEFRFESRMGL